MNDWIGTILPRAVDIVESYDTGVTLRQLFYRLVSEGLIANSTVRYNQLSRRSARWRREGKFPDLVDTGRSIKRPFHFSGPTVARMWLRAQYRRNRTEGQPYNVYLGLEKDALSRQV